MAQHLNVNGTVMGFLLVGQERRQKVALDSAIQHVKSRKLNGEWRTNSLDIKCAVPNLIFAGYSES